MQPFLAMIVPMGSGVGGGGPVDPGYGVGTPPSQIWGGRPGPGPGGGWVGSPPSIWPSPGHPAHPIHYPWTGDPGFSAPPGWGPGSGKPPGIWGGGNEPFPTPPIVIPPNKPGDPPLVIWGGSNEPFPTPPIELPGIPKPPEGGGPPVKLIEWKTAWSPSTGWIVVGVPQVPHPAPAK